MPVMSAIRFGSDAKSEGTLSVIERTFFPLSARATTPAKRQASSGGANLSPRPASTRRLALKPEGACSTVSSSALPVNSSDWYRAATAALQRGGSLSIRRIGHSLPNQGAVRRGETRVRCSWVASAARAFFEGLAGGAISLALPLGLALVIELFALGQGHLAFYLARFPIEAQGNEGQAFFARFAFDALDLRLVEQQAPRAVGLVGGVTGVLVGADVAIQQHGLAVAKQRVAVFELGLAVAQRLHLAPGQRDARFPMLQDVVIVPRLPIFGNILVLGNAVGLGHAYSL